MTSKIEVSTGLSAAELDLDILALYFSLVANGHLRATSLDKFREMIFFINKIQDKEYKR